MASFIMLVSPESDQNTVLVTSGFQLFCAGGQPLTGWGDEGPGLAVRVNGSKGGGFASEGS